MLFWFVVGYFGFVASLVAYSAHMTWLQARSNDVHRWLEDSYPLPGSQTAGKTEITVTLTPTPGAPPWTATQYSADSLTG
ncbi:hypothetical protein [Nocardia sp. NPDC046763]|uniref:hypothetical protein n=1 Tax=Nocardia sp. NPDC046763 TaxID=3155256 RepID=UPI0033ED187A